jgi:HAD superfamily hydrolase (TIGR01509 family)
MMTRNGADVNSDPGGRSSRNPRRAGRDLVAAVFDLDGTLIDSVELWFEAAAGAVALHGGAIDQRRTAAVMMGRAWSSIWPELLRACPEGVALDRLQAATRDLMERLRRDRDLTIPGSVAFLRHLHRHGVRIAIASGSTRTEIAWAVEHCGIGDCVSAIVGCEDYRRGKPDPEPFQIAAERLRAPPSACLAVEDSAVGVQSARNAGMSVLALARPRAPAQDYGSADWCLDDLMQLLAVDPAAWWSTADRGAEEGWQASPTG